MAGIASARKDATVDRRGLQHGAATQSKKQLGSKLLSVFHDKEVLVEGNAAHSPSPIPDIAAKPSKTEPFVSLEERGVYNVFGPF